MGSESETGAGSEAARQPAEGVGLEPTMGVICQYCFRIGKKRKHGAKREGNTPAVSDDPRRSVTRQDGNFAGGLRQRGEA